MIEELQDLKSETLSTGVVVLDVFSTWCQPCSRMMKLLPRLQEHLGKEATVVKIDVDVVPEVKEKYGITKIPTFLILDHGVEVNRFEGIHPIANIQSAVLTQLLLRSTL
jgi:thioredoxin-like negative regulator of GroEL